MRLQQTGDGTSAATPRYAPASLTREEYVSQGIFDREMELLVSRSWLYAGHASQLRNVGDYLLRRVGYESIIVVRSEPDRIDAFFNVCRHRGSLLCDAPTGQQKRFVCPYHRWSFSLGGRLEHAPGLRDDHDGVRFEDLGLTPARLELVHGLIFINLDCDAEPLRSQMFHEGGVAPARPERTKIAAEQTYRMHANWKLVSENLTECYHCPGAHPEFSKVCNVSEMYRRSKLAPGSVDLEATEGLPLRVGAQTLTIDGRPSCARLLGDFGEGSAGRPGYNAFITVFPIPCIANYFIDYGVLFDVRPVSVAETDFVCQWFVHEDAVEGEDYQSDELTELWDVTTRQDVVLCERQQAGVMSRSYRPGPTGVGREGGTAAGFLETYASLIGPH